MTPLRQRMLEGARAYVIAGNFVSQVIEPSRRVSAASSPSTLDAGNRTHRLMSETSGNGQRDSRAATKAEVAPEGNSAQGQLDRLNAALGNTQTLTAFEALVESVETRVGLTAAGFNAASLGLMPLPERWRRVLDGLRRMQARSDLTPSQRKSKVHAILAQNIGVTLGPELKPDGSLRIVPVKADYAAIGDLVGEHGAENVWVTACEIAGVAIEGDPLDCLRAALRHKRERSAGGNGRTGQSGYGAGAHVGELRGEDYVRDLIAEHC